MEEYSGYRALFGFPRENINANKFFIDRGNKCLDSCLDMRLVTNCFNEINTQITILKITEESFDSYADFHDKHWVNSYWTSDRLRKELDKWHIFVYGEEQIEASIFITFCNEDTIEIFGVAISEENKKEGLKEKLISAALKEIFKEYPTIKNTIFFIDDNEEEDLRIANALGFNYFSSYRCYEWQIWYKGVLWEEKSIWQ